MPSGVVLAVAAAGDVDAVRRGHLEVAVGQAAGEVLDARPPATAAGSGRTGPRDRHASTRRGTPPQHRSREASRVRARARRTSPRAGRRSARSGRRRGRGSRPRPPLCTTWSTPASSSRATSSVPVLGVDRDRAVVQAAEDLGVGADVEAGEVEERQQVAVADVEEEVRGARVVAVLDQLGEREAEHVLVEARPCVSTSLLISAVWCRPRAVRRRPLAASGAGAAVADPPARRPRSRSGRRGVVAHGVSSCG